MIPGDVFGSYRVLGKLGEGGMGEVYRARDTKLDRDVALKILPESFAGDPDRLMRFEREAKTLASLNHPHIAQIYGFETVQGSGGMLAPPLRQGSGAALAALTHALVMELVEGEDLSQRITRGAIPIDEALPIAKQIAQALEGAHEQGIIHRDLKPANIKVRADGTVKVLDFGLAKAIEGAGGAGRAGASGRDEVHNSPTITSPAMTAAGMILGTAAYMSPEQAKGKPVDRRADMWAFGCVVFEMLTDTRAFGGEDVTDTLAKIVMGEPQWSQLPAATPTPVRRLLRRCLEKDRKRRLDSAAVAVLEIDEATSAASDSQTSAVRQPRSSRLTLAAMFALGAAIASPLVMIAMRRTAASPPAIAPVVTRLEISTPPSDDPMSYALSPDGRQLAFIASSDNVSKIWIRSLDQATARPLAGTDGANYPFWSPRGDALGFFADGKLKRIDVAAGGLRVLADAPSGRGGTWSEDGVIAFAPTTGSPCLRIPESGGVTEPLLEDGAVGVALCRWPQFLPDRRHVLFWGGAITQDSLGVYLADADGANARQLLKSRNSGVYDTAGYLLVVEQDALIARRFDPDRPEPGPPLTVATGVGNDSSYRSGIAVSSSALLLRDAAAVRRQLVWIDRRGTRVGTFGPPDDYAPTNPALSPDDQRVAVQRYGNSAGVWVMDRTRETPLRFSGGQIAGMPLWSPDGSRLWWAGLGREGYAATLVERLTNGTSAERQLSGQSPGQLTDWSQDGRVVIAQFSSPKTGYDVRAIRIEGGNNSEPFSVVEGPFDQRNATFAPDSKWIVYDSNETGRFEVYVQPFPPTGGKWQISTGGGITPRWSHSGREVFYVAPDGSMMSAPVRISSDGKASEPGVATRLFSTAIVPAGGNRHQYVVAKDDQRFLINSRVDDRLTTPITIVQNWAAELGKK